MDSAGNYYTYSNVLLHLAPTDRDPVVPEQANLILSSEAIKLTTFCRLIRHQAPHQRLSLAYIMRIWFQKGIGPGTIITLDRPVPLRWKIVQKLSEDDLQLTEGEHLSVAVTKILCLTRSTAQACIYAMLYASPL